MDISAKTALVTGGASGLGLATTTMLALAGARVVVIDLPSADQSLLNDIEGDVVFAPADVTSEDERSEEHTSELQSRGHLVCRLLLEKKNKQYQAQSRRQ